MLGNPEIREHWLDEEHTLKVSIFGLGYVGTVSAARLTNDGHEVIGVDPVQININLTNNGQFAAFEVDIGEILS